MHSYDKLHKIPLTVTFTFSTPVLVRTAVITFKKKFILWFIWFTVYGLDTSIAELMHGIKGVLFHINVRSISILLQVMNLGE